MESYQLNPAQSAITRAELQRRKESKIEKKYIKFRKCKFCNQEKVSFYELQTRSLDEPKTMFFECDNCDNTWT
jgi:DNA-directed RNA polymerase subunit M/transcription elongation factor TFIIS